MIDSGETLDISGASAATVSFANSSGSTGELVLDDSKGFTGQIVGFTGDGTTANSDLIDLSDINITGVVTSKTTYTDNGNGTGTSPCTTRTGKPSTASTSWANTCWRILLLRTMVPDTR
jgi:hypothetical protein